MIEALDLRPPLGGMAGLTTRGAASWACNVHSLGKLALVGIFVAPGARHLCKVVGSSVARPRGGLRLMTIRAWNCHMRARQRKLRLRMAWE